MWGSWLRFFGIKRQIRVNDIFMRAVLYSTVSRSIYSLRGDLMKKVKKMCRYVSFGALMLILAYEIPALNAFCRAAVVWFRNITGCPWLFSGVTNNVVYIAERILVGLMVLSAAVIFLVIQLEERKAKLTKNAEGDTAFEKSFLRYLNHSHESRCYLISGRTGSGKTHMLQDFIKKYYSNSKVMVYEVSCIGLTTRKDVTSEISKAIEAKDETIRKELLEIIRKLPIFGDFFGNILKKHYGYMSADEGSIFVFDDFERLLSYMPGANTDISRYRRGISNNINETLERIVA